MGLLPATMADQQEEDCYDDDFENCYEEDFESDAELEVPPQTTALEDTNESATIITVDARVSLSGSLRCSPPTSKGGRQQGAAAGCEGLFSRALFAADVGGTATTSGLARSSDVNVTLQPPLPPMSSNQRRQAAAALQRSKQLQQHVKLHLSTQLDVLVQHPLSLYQQHCQGIGVYAARTAAACQTRQLEQDIREQEMQTDQIEEQQCGCQVPDDLYKNTSQHSGAKPASCSVPAELLAAANPQLADFLDWAVPQVLFELGRADAAAAAETSMASAAAGPRFDALQTAADQTAHCNSSSNSSSSDSHRGLRSQLLSGELQLASGKLLAGRPVVDLTGPPTSAAAAAAAQAITLATTAVSNHLLLVCYGPVSMPADLAVKEHGFAGLGCLCVWDLLQSGASAQNPTAAGTGGNSCGIAQLLVCEGQPTCCCWGAGDAASLVFAGMNEGGVCCWDLSEHDTAHTAGMAVTGPAAQQGLPNRHQKHQQTELNLPARRPAYSTEVPWSADSVSRREPTMCLGDAVALGDSIAALTALPASTGSHSCAGYNSSGGCVGRLVVLTAGGCVSLYSVMLGDAGSDVAIQDLGMRTGSCVWLVNVCEGLPLGLQVLKHPRMQSSSTAATSAGGNSVQRFGGMHAASCLLMLPDAVQHLLVGTLGGCVLKGAARGAVSAPHEYVSAQWWPGCRQAGPADTAAVLDASDPHTSSSVGKGLSGQQLLLGAVTSLSVCPGLPDAWAAGYSSGRIAVFSQRCSQPRWVWQHPLGTPVIAVRWLPQASSFVALCVSDGGNGSSAAGSLLAFQIVDTKWQLTAASTLSTQPGLNCVAEGAASCAQPCCMEVLSASAGATSTRSSCCDVGSSVGICQTTVSSKSSQQGQPAGSCCVALGFDDGSCRLYQLAATWTPEAAGRKAEFDTLQSLLAG